MPHFSFGLPVGAVCQFAFYVNDIPAAMGEYSKQLGVGPWFYMERVAIKNSYRGKPSVFNGSVAIGFVARSIVAPAKSEIEGQVRFDLPVVLREKSAIVRDPSRSVQLGEVVCRA